MPGNGVGGSWGDPRAESPPRRPFGFRHPSYKGGPPLAGNASAKTAVAEEGAAKFFYDLADAVGGNIVCVSHNRRHDPQKACSKWLFPKRTPS